jgi:hypothetical protein
MVYAVFTSSGSIAWRSNIALGGGRIACDGTNFYVTSAATTLWDGTAKTVAKLDSSGTLQWATNTGYTEFAAMRARNGRMLTTGGRVISTADGSVIRTALGLYNYVLDDDGNVFGFNGSLVMGSMANGSSWTLDLSRTVQGMDVA